MARVKKHDEYAARRDEILAAAQRLIETKGYAQMAIQDVLDAVGMSKGAFYHYFDSKQALLEAIVERMMQQVQARLTPLVNDPHLTALEKLRGYFASTGSWKTERMDFILDLLRVWYTDDNAIVRQRVHALGAANTRPVLAKFIREGMAQGALSAAHPDEMSEIVFAVLYALGDKLAMMMLSPDPKGDLAKRMKRVTAIYTDALERLLGAAHGSLQLMDARTLKKWAVPINDGRTDVVKSALRRSTNSKANKISVKS